MFWMAIPLKQTAFPWSALLRVGFVALSLTGASPVQAQDDPGHVAWREGRRLAVDGQPDSALAAFVRAATAARATGDRAIATAAARGIADVQLVYRGCADSAQSVLTAAVADAAPGDRSAADALVRLLASRGDLTRARATLVKAYDDIPSVGRQITRESVTFLQGMAALERFGGHESAALSTLNSALQIAVRMHEGDAQDSIPHAVGPVSAEDMWVMYDLAQLRLRAKSPAVASAREAERIYGLLIDAWPTVAERELTPFPVSRLQERLDIRARTCTKNGTSCPVPKPPKC